MRFATILPEGASAPVVAAATAEGGWAPLQGLIGRPVETLEQVLPSITDGGANWARALTQGDAERFPAGGIRFLPPVPRPLAFRDFYAFEAHVKTARARRGLPMVPAWYEIPAFYFSNHNALVGHDDRVKAPAGCAELDYELELGVVIGRGGRDIPLERAWEHVAGFTIINDLSARDLQRREMAIGLGPAKGKDFATAVGPWLVTRDEFADRIEGERLSLEMVARVNGRELSRGNVSSLHHSIPALIAHASRDVMLFPGELLGTGTVGTGCILELGPETTGGWLEPGDVVELEIERIGVLRTSIVART
jgi:2-keto-4-pentenoate hydratase/2-oxohepta-3-ene-1,7-dioic acid hydratase in catechol pathway